jgi:hypothetical protein
VLHDFVYISVRTKKNISTSKFLKWVPPMLECLLKL